MDHEQTPTPPPSGKQAADKAGAPLAGETIEFLEILSLLTPNERQVVLTTGRMFLHARATSGAG